MQSDTGIDYEPQFNELQTDVPITKQQRYDFLRHNNYGYTQGVVISCDTNRCCYCVAVV